MRFTEQNMRCYKNLKGMRILWKFDWELTSINCYRLSLLGNSLLISHKMHWLHSALMTLITHDLHTVICNWVRELNHFKTDQQTVITQRFIVGSDLIFNWGLQRSPITVRDLLTVDSLTVKASGGLSDNAESIYSKKQFPPWAASYHDFFAWITTYFP